MTGRPAPWRTPSARARVAILAGLLVIAGVALATVTHGMAAVSGGDHGPAVVAAATQQDVPADSAHHQSAAPVLAAHSSEHASDGCAGCLSAPHDVAVACALLVAAVLLALGSRARRHLWQTADAPVTIPPPVAVASRPHRPDLLSLGVSRT
ncbi:hypothetical protein [Demequina sp. NBRC 110056]|uniref:hypothetical protein n=1 Tax=Demequina sp. NBRC 110056 TaxID=1570345 RepID=UPI000A0741E1|nr:hypothetical protein [Demequina sp. NBRC 110056]